MGEPEHLRATYNDVHNLIKNSASKIAEFKPDIFIAIGGGGFFPARVLRTFLKNPETKHNIPIYAIGLSLYEALPGTTEEHIGKEIVRTQWLGPESGKVLLGRRALIIDEIDDSRKTLQYAVEELRKDVEREVLFLPESEREAARTQFAIFVVHNKLKLKLGTIPPDVPCVSFLAILTLVKLFHGHWFNGILFSAAPRYFAGAEVDDLWLDYPWEASDIEEHDRLAKAQNSEA
ncbi:hypothetical protein EW146_g10501 [Bondarzewia mesenterica]|uniref:Phosphoribosyltransferase domain-containing protein n=1 Tax=Bondarzewia mesenterica TaxID=1095465 RepID=A0A4S4KWD3_9AGAM|nr:hypothetical protein EW146_g10501 [Bondarzewia mesenterica]